jgi:hypothetical protein
MEIKDEQEWSAIEPKVSEVYDARAELMASGIPTRIGRRSVNEIEPSEP